MDIILYEKKDTDAKLYDDLKFWSNCEGTLHKCGGDFIRKSELPSELKKAYKLWSNRTGAKCYLVEYKGEYKIALVNEFHRRYYYNMPKMFENLKERAEEYSKDEKFDDVVILIGEESGYFSCHEFITLIPYDAKKLTFNSIAKRIRMTLYQYS